MKAKRRNLNRKKKKKEKRSARCQLAARKNPGGFTPFTRLGPTKVRREQGGKGKKGTRDMRVHKNCEWKGLSGRREGLESHGALSPSDGLAGGDTLEGRVSA